jgi:hypothetical protein
MLHVLYISASVTRLRWRLPANDKFLLEDEDRHSSMLAVATAPIKGASAGFPGLLGLWSFHRPFMPLSVVEGHREGAVMDFDWLDTPQPKQNDTGRSLSTARMLSTIDLKGDKRGGSSRLQGSTNEADSTRDTGEADEYDKPIGIWQHVISVGRDGRCLLQSFVRGKIVLYRSNRSSILILSLTHFPYYRRPTHFARTTVLLCYGEPVSFSEGIWFASSFFSLSTNSLWSTGEFPSNRAKKRQHHSSGTRSFSRATERDISRSCSLSSEKPLDVKEKYAFGDADTGLQCLGPRGTGPRGQASGAVTASSYDCTRGGTSVPLCRIVRLVSQRILSY